MVQGVLTVTLAMTSIFHGCASVSYSGRTNASPSGINSNTPRSASASVQRPVISHVHATPAPTSCTVSWTTDKLSDSLAEFGTGMGPWIPAWSEMGRVVTDTTAPGVTSHSQTITNLWPGFTYSIYLRSRPFSGAILETNARASGWYDGASGCNPLKDGSVCSCRIPPTKAIGRAYDFRLGIAGPHNVVQGYDTYLQVYYADIARPSDYVASDIDITISGLPPASRVSRYDPNNFVGSFDSGMGLLKLHPSTIYQDTALHITTTASTPIGRYTITFSDIHSERYPAVTRSYEYTLNVIKASFPYGTPSSYPSIPAIGDKNSKGTWVYGMVTVGASAAFCNQNSGAGANFYDAIRAYQQTMAYDTANSITGNPSQWETCIANRKAGYLRYVNRVPHGKVWAIYLASKGMMTLALGGDLSAKTALYQTADNAQWRTLRASMMDVGLERELNFTAESLIAASVAGDENQAGLIPVAIDYLLADIDQIVNSSVSHEPFIDGTVADTLIHYYVDTKGADARIPPAIKALADHLWNRYWIPGVCSGTPTAVFKGCFAYSAGLSQMGIDASTNGSPSNEAGLNLLIAPMYAWLFKMTGNGAIPGSDGSQCGGTPGQPCTYQQAGDTIFQKGISQSDYYQPKSWAQNYRWSFDYVLWRSRPKAYKK